MPLKFYPQTFEQVIVIHIEQKMFNGKIISCKKYCFSKANSNVEMIMIFKFLQSAQNTITAKQA